jgi:ribose transport system permease protein
MSTIAGILIAGKLGSVTLGIGEPYLFTSVAVVAIGGASILGGSGNVIGTFGGACLLAVASAAIPVLGVPIAFTFIVFGLIILAAVTVSTSGRFVRG